MVVDGVPLKKALTDCLEDDVVAADDETAATRLYDTGTTPRRGADAPTDRNGALCRVLLAAVGRVALPGACVG